MFWRRLVEDGVDTCSFDKVDQGWMIDGTAVFLDDRGPSWQHYRVMCNEQWVTRQADVKGWTGQSSFVMQARRSSAGRWTVNDEVMCDFDGLSDVDLGFTPATNTIAIRRMRLAVGEEAQTTAVWLDTSDWAVKPLRQRYKRIGRSCYAYQSPLHGYHAVLRTDAFGCVLDYPELWYAEGF